jgi:hypothetical protein
MLVGFLLKHTYICFKSEGVAEASQIFLREKYFTKMTIY